MHFKVGDFVCSYEGWCENRQCLYPFGCDIASSCPNYLAEVSIKNLFVCSVCHERQNVIIDHILPNFRLCYKDALQLARHLIEDATRLLFDTQSPDKRQFDEIVKLIRSRCKFPEENSSILKQNT